MALCPFTQLCNHHYHPSQIYLIDLSPQYGASQVALVVKKKTRKHSTANTGDIKRCEFDPGSGRSLGGGHSNPLQYSCLGNPMHKGAWWATDHKVAKNQTRLK